jgi:diguanylate cyclase (GGDEF)-like protein
MSTDDFAETGLAGAATVRRSAPPWWSGPGVRVVALTAAMATVAALVQITVLGGYAWSYPKDVMMMGVLMPMSVASEGLAVHIRVRRGGHAVSLSEIPVVLGLIFTGPLVLLLSRVVGGAIGLILLRRQRGIKLAFNVAMLGLHTTIGVAVFHALAGTPGTLGPREWLAAFAAMVVVEVLGSVLITAAIAFHDDPGEWRRLPRTATREVPFVVVTTSIALASALVVQRDLRAVTLLAVVFSVTFLAYRAYVRQSQGHAQVESLYAFTRALHGSVSRGDTIRTLLDQVRDQMRAEIAAILIFDRPSETWTRTRMANHGEIETHSLSRAAASAWWAPAARGQPVLVRADSGRAGQVADTPGDGIAVPVAIGDAGTAVLLVADSLPDLPTFDEEQVRLFQALANHAGVSLANAGLLDQLRTEVRDKEHLAMHDPLTDLPNRRRFLQLLETSLSTPGTGVTAVMLMDLDRFKEVNDALGHDTGDALLRHVAERLRSHLTGRGVIARLGGDEFAVLLSGLASTEEAVAVGKDLARAMDTPVPINQLNVNARASIGIACGPDHGDAAATLLQRADVAMYAAKKAHSGVRLYQPRDDKNTAQRLALIGELAEAIERRDLLLHFQPKMEPGSGTVTGAEALARWHHSRHGTIPPDVFIPLAEHSGLIRPLTIHILEVALRRCAAWQRAGHDLQVAVNLSPNGLLDTTLPEVVTRLLGQTGVAASALTLEITESTIMADPTGAVVTLQGLRAVGVKLSIDDFGTGHSSLSRLRELPIQEVKIDKSFVQRLAADPRDRAVVRSVVQLGHALDLQVVAEGVEDAATVEHLAAEGCDLIQGYFISPPLPATQFDTWLAGRPTRPANTSPAGLHA